MNKLYHAKKQLIQIKAVRKNQIIAIVENEPSIAYPIIGCLINREEHN